jgi:hypothetical protein
MQALQVRNRQSANCHAEPKADPPKRILSLFEGCCYNKETRLCHETYGSCAGHDGCCARCQTCNCPWQLRRLHVALV